MHAAENSAEGGVGDLIAAQRREVFLHGLVADRHACLASCVGEDFGVHHLTLDPLLVGRCQIKRLYAELGVRGATSLDHCSVACLVDRLLESGNQLTLGHQLTKLAIGDLATVPANGHLVVIGRLRCSTATKATANNVLQTEGDHQ